MPDINFGKTSLFGGAITADLPSDFEDVSDMRQVPDNQEVFLARTGLTSIVIEITERVAQPEHSVSTDEEALLYHYEDLVAAGYGRDKPHDEIKEETRIWRELRTTVGNLGIDVPAYTLFGTQEPEPPVRQNGDGDARPDFTAILFTLIRLEKQNADLLISINVPHASGEYDRASIDMENGKEGPLVEKADDYMDQLLMTFKIEDWSLFPAE